MNEGRTACWPVTPNGNGSHEGSIPSASTNGFGSERLRATETVTATFGWLFAVIVSSRTAQPITPVRLCGERVAFGDRALSL